MNRMVKVTTIKQWGVWWGGGMLTYQPFSLKCNYLILQHERRIEL